MNDFVAIDVETANREPSSICAIGAVKVRDGIIVDSIYTLIYPEPEYYSRFCTAVHGITMADTQDAPNFATAWRRIYAWTEGLPLVAHNWLWFYYEAPPPPLPPKTHHTMTPHTLNIPNIFHTAPTPRIKRRAHLRHTAASAIAAMAIALTLGACSDNSRTTPTRENIMPIERAALRDARHAMSARDVRERESILIDIRAKEYALRSRGYTHSADIYINAVRAALDTAALDAE